MKFLNLRELENKFKMVGGALEEAYLAEEMLKRLAGRR